jgi:hypothetical protein
VKQTFEKCVCVCSCLQCLSPETSFPICHLSQSFGHTRAINPNLNQLAEKILIPNAIRWNEITEKLHGH